MDRYSYFPNIHNKQRITADMLSEIMSPDLVIFLQSFVLNYKYVSMFQQGGSACY